MELQVDLERAEGLHDAPAHDIVGANQAPRLGLTGALALLEICAVGLEQVQEVLSRDDVVALAQAIERFASRHVREELDLMGGETRLDLLKVQDGDERALVGRLTRALHSLEGKVSSGASADELREQVAAAARAAQTAAKVAASPSGTSSKQMLAKVKADLKALEEIVRS